MEGMSKEEKAEMRKYETEEDLRTLARAAEIKADKDRMKRVRAAAKAQMDALKDLSA